MEAHKSRQKEKAGWKERGENGVDSRTGFKSQLWRLLKFSGTVGKAFPV